jgi:hypothetical protein
MGIKWLGGKEWNSSYSRDERFVCARLFNELTKDDSQVKKLVSKIRDKCLCGEKDHLHPCMSGLDPNWNWEVGLEVCFYRDYLYPLNENTELEKRLHKRTFDLCLFSDEAIVIIEAKVHEGFETGQLRSFNVDRTTIPEKLNNQLNKDQVYIVGLTSAGYSPKPSTLSYFNGFLRWEEMQDLYNPESTFMNCAIGKRWDNAVNRKWKQAEVELTAENVSELTCCEFSCKGGAK